jgi:riboflavin kinase/FMN adenylyltransferase
VSSTRIRALLAAGDVGMATKLLGRVPDVGGRVVEGDRRGRTIGFPTANLDCETVVMPEDGVYAVVAKLDGEDDVLRGVANLGVRPTFAAGRSVEVHLFDFDREVYDRRLRVGFVERIREERKFDGLDALVAQIGKDAEDARRMIAAAAEGGWRWL